MLYLRKYSSLLIGVTVVACLCVYGVSFMKSVVDLQAQLVLTSTDFKDGEYLAKKQAYTRCGGDNQSPALSWSNVPTGTKSFALTVEDPDAPQGMFVHWIIYNIPAAITSLPTGVDKTEVLAEELQGAIQGTNNFENIGYDGPCPPSGTHRYIFTLYALDTVIDSPMLSKPVTYTVLMQAIKSHVRAQAKLMGLYSSAKK